MEDLEGELECRATDDVPHIIQFPEPEGSLCLLCSNRKADAAVATREHLCSTGHRGRLQRWIGPKSLIGVLESFRKELQKEVKAAEENAMEFEFRPGSGGGVRRAWLQELVKLLRTHDAELCGLFWHIVVYPNRPKEDHSNDISSDLRALDTALSDMIAKAQLPEPKPLMPTPKAGVDFPCYPELCDSLTNLTGEGLKPDWHLNLTATQLITTGIECPLSSTSRRQTRVMKLVVESS